MRRRAFYEGQRGVLYCMRCGVVYCMGCRGNVLNRVRRVALYGVWGVYCKGADGCTEWVRRGVQYWMGCRGVYCLNADG